MKYSIKVNLTEQDLYQLQGGDYIFIGVFQQKKIKM